MNQNYRTYVGELKMINPNGIFLMCESYSDSEGAFCGCDDSGSNYYSDYVH